MAIYHFSAKVISRTNGSSAVASAAYRSAERLHDDRLDRAKSCTIDFCRIEARTSKKFSIGDSNGALQNNQLPPECSDRGH
jgi:hypothetical protein